MYSSDGFCFCLLVVCFDCCSKALIGAPRKFVSAWILFVLCFETI